MSNRETATEYFDPEALDENSIPPLPKPTDDHFYSWASLLHFFPAINSKGCTFSASDFDQQTLDNLTSRAVNFEHDKRKVLGTVRRVLKTTSGLLILIEFDRDMVQHQGLTAADFGPDGRYNGVSMEATRSADKSLFIVHNGNGRIIETLDAQTAKARGLRRSTKRDPYRYNGNPVAERLSGANFTGAAAAVANPSDKSARHLRVVASDVLENSLSPQGAPITIPNGSAVYGTVGDRPIRRESAYRKPMPPLPLTEIDLL